MAFLEFVAGTARARIIAADFAQRVAHRRLNVVMVVIMVVIAVRTVDMLVVMVMIVIAIRAMNMAVGMRVHENS